MKEILKAMRAREAAISGLKKTGCLGENNRGYVELRACPGLKDAEKKNAAQKTLASENKDRKALYREIARLGKAEKMTVSMVEGVWAMKRLDRGKKGEYFQLSEAGAAFEKFKKAALGKKLGAKCVAKAWIQIP